MLNLSNLNQIINGFNWNKSDCLYLDPELESDLLLCLLLLDYFYCEVTVFTLKKKKPKVTFINSYWNVWIDSIYPKVSQTLGTGLCSGIMFQLILFSRLTWLPVLFWGDHLSWWLFLIGTPALHLLTASLSMQLCPISGAGSWRRTRPTRSGWVRSLVDCLDRKKWLRIQTI